MSLPQKINQKKTRRMRFNPYPSRGRKRLLVDGSHVGEVEDSNFGNTGLSIEEMRGPGSWLENECLENTLENNLLRIVEQRNSFFDRPRSILDADEDCNPDIGSDYDDFIEEDDFE